jgi:chemotaxis protein CheD
MGSTIVPPHSLPRPRTAPPLIVVGVADLKHASLPNAVISTVGLGSCLAVTCYDPFAKVGGLLHAMLPDSQKHRQSAPVTAMYLDTGVPELLEATYRLGGDPRCCELKVFGGAQILRCTEYFNIGRQNIDMMHELVAEHRLTVKVWEVGGQLNRSIKLHLDTGRVVLRMPGKPEVAL